MSTNPECKVSIVSNLWVKQMKFTQVGCLMQGHKHTFDHQTLLSVGIFKITIEEKTIERNAPLILFIDKDKIHSIECMTDYGLAYCIHPIRDGERVEDIVDPEDMPMFNGSLSGKTSFAKD